MAVLDTEKSGNIVQAEGASPSGPSTWLPLPPEKNAQTFHEALTQSSAYLTELAMTLSKALGLQKLSFSILIRKDDVFALAKQWYPQWAGNFKSYQASEQQTTTFIRYPEDGAKDIDCTLSLTQCHLLMCLDRMPPEHEEDNLRKALFSYLHHSGKGRPCALAKDDLIMNDVEQVFNLLNNKNSVLRDRYSKCFAIMNLLRRAAAKRRALELRVPEAKAGAGEKTNYTYFIGAHAEVLAIAAQSPIRDNEAMQAVVTAYESLWPARSQKQRIRSLKGSPTDSRSLHHVIERCHTPLSVLRRDIEQAGKALPQGLLSAPYQKERDLLTHNFTSTKQDSCLWKLRQHLLYAVAVRTYLESSLSSSTRGTNQYRCDYGNALYCDLLEQQEILWSVQGDKEKRLFLPCLTNEHFLLLIARQHVPEWEQKQMLQTYDPVFMAAQACLWAYEATHPVGKLGDEEKQRKLAEKQRALLGKELELIQTCPNPLYDSDSPFSGPVGKWIAAVRAGQKLPIEEQEGLALKALLSTHPFRGISSSALYLHARGREAECGLLQMSRKAGAFLDIQKELGDNLAEQALQLTSYLTEHQPDMFAGSFS